MHYNVLYAKWEKLDKNELRKVLTEGMILSYGFEYQIVDSDSTLNDNLRDVAEYVFEKYNDDKVTKKLKIRSMCVGDGLIFEDGHILIAAPIGFSEFIIDRNYWKAFLPGAKVHNNKEK